ncbi:N-acetylmuramic acid 6-phosphate etherase [Balneicella halophila]|uniref:N-acetylmuramic acid 6-phosphate etherase n=1 Tax=Balneicella halophila TaxID=1537566 RepID=A0A7L4UN62_BALHA|nr:N-acetylmuramic acid 6-phosphate etherase [Balneicella halophila]PVX49982.1 N-acetylmuramic acid 6-phosphate etherase [Balneicella halophila]
MKNITESSSEYEHLDEMSVSALLEGMNEEDRKVYEAIQKTLPEIEKLVKAIVPRIKEGGRVFYIGAGTSGRLGVLDASELPPTFGVSDGIFIGLIAGGDIALRKAVENAEDDTKQAWKTLQDYEINEKDVVIGIAASGTTPYVIGGVKTARDNGLLTACITCNPNSPLGKAVDIPIEAVVGSEFVTGSTRLKSGTAQKMILNMISTVTMIQLGKVSGNKMVHMQLTNQKLVERGSRMLMDELDISYNEAKKLLRQHGSVSAALNSKR